MSRLSWNRVGLMQISLFDPPIIPPGTIVRQSRPWPTGQDRQCRGDNDPHFQEVHQRLP
jgi:hypothetical protein